MIRLIILIVIAILALSYFGISIRHIVESPAGTENFGYVWGQVKDGWDILATWFTEIIDKIKHIF